MKRRCAVFAVIFEVSILIGIQVVEVVDANPFPIPWPSAPNQEKPTLALECPQNGSIYVGGSLPVDFTVTAPRAWDPTYFPGIHYVGEIHSADVYLDGNLTVHDANYQVIIYSNGAKIAYNPEEFESNIWHLTTFLNQTAPGTHTLNVTVLADTYYNEPVFGDSSIKTNMTSDGKPVYRYPIFVSDIVNFSVRKQTEDQTSFLLDQTTLSTIAIVIVIVAVTSILLVYFKKRKHEAG